jgi:GNAT superfamily N-acetyltransferase
VHQGASLIIATHAENSHEGRHCSPSDRFFDFLANIFLQGVRKLQSPKQRERAEENTRKMTAVIQNTIGDNAKDMLCVNGICTSPASQGRGYGGAVLDSITSIADAQGRAAWLISSNINNTEFYNSHGFMTVGTYVVGDENPEWHEIPVVISIMVRKPM